MKLRALLAIGGSRRYSAAVFVDAVGAGLLRPFLLLYGLQVIGLELGPTGVALTIGLLLGLCAIPPTGRWIDRSGGRPPVIGALTLRALGVVALLAADSLPTFVLAASLMSTGTQMWPGAHAALVTALTSDHDRDVALSAGRALRNAGLGAGALLATAALAGGVDALRVLAALSGCGYLVAALLVWSTKVPPLVRREPADGTPVEVADPGGRALLALLLLNLPFALVFDVLEVALPAVFLEQLHTGASWPGAVFVANTVLVVALSVPIALRVARRSRRHVFCLAGLVLAGSYVGFLFGGALTGTTGAGVVAIFAVVFTIGEILYTGSGIALVIATTPPERLGRAIGRWELSTGIGKAAAPAVLTGLFGVTPALLWAALAVATAVAGVAVARYGPLDTGAAEMTAVDANRDDETASVIHANVQHIEGHLHEDRRTPV